MLQDWQLREKHENDVRGTMERLGFLNRDGSMRRYDGARYWAEMEKLGHSSTRLEECACWRERYV